MKSIHTILSAVLVLLITQSIFASTAMDQVQKIRNEVVDLAANLKSGQFPQEDSVNEMLAELQSFQEVATAQSLKGDIFSLPIQKAIDNISAILDSDEYLQLNSYPTVAEQKRLNQLWMLRNSLVSLQLIFYANAVRTN